MQLVAGVLDAVEVVRHVAAVGLVVGDEKAVFRQQIHGVAFALAERIKRLAVEQRRDIG